MSSYSARSPSPNAVEEVPKKFTEESRRASLSVPGTAPAAAPSTSAAVQPSAQRYI